MKVRKWEDKTPRQHQEWNERVLLEIGSSAITLGQFAEAGYTHFSAVRGLNKAIKSLDPKGIKELARRADPEKILSLRGVGTEKLCAFMHALDIAGGNSDEWYHSDEKMTTHQRRAKPPKKLRVRLRRKNKKR